MTSEHYGRIRLAGSFSLWEERYTNEVLNVVDKPCMSYAYIPMNCVLVREWIIGEQYFVVLCAVLTHSFFHTLQARIHFCLRTDTIAHTRE